MKLRVRSNSLRLRVGPREVQALLRSSSLEETVRFGPTDTQILRYRLELRVDDGPISAKIDGSDIVVSVARSVAEDWAHDEGLTLSGEQHVGVGQTLQILVEKDLQCLESTAAIEEDVYPNPSATCQ